MRAWLTLALAVGCARSEPPVEVMPRLPGMAAVEGATGAWADACENGDATACRRLGELARRALLVCERMRAAARIRRIDEFSDPIDVKGAILAWRDARFACGDLWNDDDQRRLEDTRTAVARNVANRARQACAVSVSEIYMAVEAEDLFRAETALADARDPCATASDNRDRIIAAEKLLTQFRRAMQPFGP